MVQNRRFGSLISIVSLTAALPWAAGCQLPEDFGKPGEDAFDPGAGLENPVDPNDAVVGDPRYPEPTDGPGPRPGEPGTGPGPEYVGQAPRRLALDLRGVAGFAILDQDAASARVTQGGATVAANVSTPSLWLGSNPLGQVIVSASGGVSTSPPMGQDLLTDEDPLAPPAEGGSAGMPVDATTLDEGGAAPTGETPSLEGDGGLVKLTDDGQIVAALVTLEEPAPEPSNMPPPEGSETSAEEPPTANPEEPATSAPEAPAPTGASGEEPVPSDVGQPPPPAAPAPAPQPLPWVKAVGLSPDGSVYILFERAFMHRQPTPEEYAQGIDPWSPGSPYTCQLFRANGSWFDGNSGDNNLAELECVTTLHQIPHWQSTRVMQFDRDGNLYFPATVEGNWQQLFLQYNPTTKQLNERVNANICFRDVQVTPRGSLFYTGTSGSDGDCSGTSFFRYVSQDNRLTEIARDWWDFKYLAEQDPEDPDNERIIFYGPDPNSESSYSWDSACIYRYDPSIEEPTERTTRLVDCVQDGWSYVYGSPYVAPHDMDSEQRSAFVERCESEDQVFVGGNGVSTLSQMTDGTLFVVGTFNMKVAGSISCNVEVTVDHCASPSLDEGSPEDCQAAGYDWVDLGGSCSDPNFTNETECWENSAMWNWGVPNVWYNSRSGSACESRAGFQVNSIDCQAPGNNPGGFARQVEGLAYIVPGASAGESEIVLLSDSEEDVEAYWPVNGPNGPQFFYSVYRGGEYSLKLATQEVGEDASITVLRRVLLSDYEVYNVQRDPADLSRVLFDGLYFPTNSYMFASMNPNLPSEDEVQASLELVQGVTGKVDTLIILPDF